MKNSFLFFLFLLLSNSISASVSFSSESRLVSESDTIPLSYKFNNCLAYIQLDQPEMNAVYLYWASDRIMVQNNYKVPANHTITMKAGNVIVLKPNTKVVTGSNYLARIEPCDRQCAIEIPKGISPNGDGLNDDFDLTTICPVKTVKIFNRYGVLLFEGESYKKEWHGQDKQNNILPSATYFYRVDFEDGQIKTGWIYLNR